MRQRNVKNQEEIIKDSLLYIDNPTKYKGKWKEKFNYKKIELEIGIGKGNFVYKKSKENIDTLYIGIELSKSVVALAIKKIDKINNEKNEIIPKNLYLSTYNALNLKDIFDEGEVDKIYLNFSDPWPKKKHTKRRLTSDEFIEIYKYILSNSGVIEFKTDNRGLFEYTLENINRLKLNIKYLTLNLHEDINSGKYEGNNILTEYEEKFMDKGPIYKVVFNFERGEVI